MFKLVGNSELKYYQIEEFVETGLVKQAFSTRLGGVSEGDFATLNLGFHTGDKAEKVIENRKRFCKELGVDARNLVAGEQVHGDAIKIVTKQERGKGALDQQSAIAATDALITAQPGVALSSYYADCVPIIILDPVQQVVALAHGGWKGTLKRIAQQTVLKMQEEFNSPIEEVLVGIGPSIGPCCYEVDEYVINPLQEAFAYWEQLVAEVSENKWKLDLWKSNSCQLEEIGVLKKNIIVSQICTACNTDHLYSYRAESGRTGRMASLIQLVD
ncbi:peptidoglycan editing factor PgeF [Fuchsiella alkaliacetigena]|uniref:peptidoglycan editing factor PgeF n=1 Tax=Fuchsiella alkaliacetigena TaxID=957042 RepID=UPI00200AC090|nr:peptidoglycan editing factor PgeF [Fuchsiella alkaliacetigena]MCK8824662.1 peptidoglycan editing factor PgeF [Fuchsiella alkaliacetigena]